MLKLFSYFFKKTGFDIGDGLYEMSKPVFREKYFNMLSAEIFT